MTHGREAAKRAGHAFVRPPKASARDVIDYEIAMLRHCASRVLRWQGGELDKDGLAILEAFLLHFRILLEFFSSPNQRFRDNLHFKTLGGYDVQPNQDIVTEASRIAGDLDRRWNERLNKFLAHPTERRHLEPRSWPVEEMRDGMTALIAMWDGCWAERPSAERDG